jgi:hypothetical protein
MSFQLLVKVECATEKTGGFYTERITCANKMPYGRKEMEEGNQKKA